MSIAKHVDPTTGKPIRQPYRETRSFAGAALRFVAALGRRAADNPDDGALLALLSVEHEASIQLQHAVDKLRTEGDRPYSNQEIGDLLGLSRQAVEKRFGGGARRRANQNGQRGSAHPSSSSPVGTGRDAGTAATDAQNCGASDSATATPRRVERGEAHAARAAS